MQISDIIIMIPSVILAIVYFKIYHSLFTVVYFKNTCLELVFEFVTCLILAGVTVITIGKLLLSILGVIGGLLLFLLGMALIVAVVGGIGYLLYRLINKNKFKTDKVERECLIEKTTSAREQASTYSEMERTTISCSSCGNMCNLNDMFCSECGNRIK